MMAVSLQAESRPTIERAVQLFLTDKKSQGLDSTAHKKHERELGRLESFMAKRGKLFPQEISQEDLTEFRAGWIGLYPSSTTRAKVQERLRGFLRYCLHAKLIDQVPKLSPIKVAESPTLPLTDGQYKKLLEAVFIEFAA
jgi:integrase/recombinase XerD